MSKIEDLSSLISVPGGTLSQGKEASLIEEQLREEEERFFSPFYHCYKLVCERNGLEEQKSDLIWLQNKADSLAGIRLMTADSEEKDILANLNMVIFQEYPEKFPTKENLMLTIGFFEYLSQALLIKPYLDEKQRYWQARQAGETKNLAFSEIELDKLKRQMVQPHWLYWRPEYGTEEQIALLQKVSKGAIPCFYVSKDGAIVIGDYQELYEIFQYHFVSRSTGLTGDGGGVGIGFRDLPVDEPNKRTAFYEWLYGTEGKGGELENIAGRVLKEQKELEVFVETTVPFIKDDKQAFFKSLFKGPFMIVLSNQELTRERYFLSRGFDPTAVFMGLSEGLTRADVYPPVLLRFMPESQKRFISFAGVAAHEIFYNILNFAGDVYDYDKGFFHTGPLEGFLHASEVLWEESEWASKWVKTSNLDEFKGRLPQGNFWQTVIRPEASFFAPRLTARFDDVSREEARRIFMQIGWRFLLTPEGEPNEQAKAQGIFKEDLQFTKDGQVNFGKLGMEWIDMVKVNNFVWRLGAIGFWALHWNHFEEVKDLTPDDFPKEWPFETLAPPCWHTWELLEKHFNIKVEYSEDLVRTMEAQTKIYQTGAELNLAKLKAMNL